MLKIALVANEPPPYRIPVFNRVAQAPGILFQVIFCCRREPNRRWNLPPLEFDHVFLHERIKTINGRYIHNNPDVIRALQQFSPDIVITNGFNPTHLYAFFYAHAKGAAFVPMTDGTYASERTLNVVHRAVRRFAYSRADAFVAASRGGQQLYESYGIPAAHCFRSCLCIDNEAFFRPAFYQEKQYDFIFCGRIEAGKNPVFALQVAAETAKILRRRTRILFVGSGSEEANLRSAATLNASFVRAVFHGFAAQEELPGLYHRAAIFLFPTAADVWGVVANEACAAGLPVIISPHAGAAGEIILDNENGFICPLDAASWAQRAAMLLSDPDLYSRFAARSRQQVSEYTFDTAAGGLLDACRHAALKKGIPLPAGG